MRIIQLSLAISLISIGLTTPGSVFAAESCSSFQATCAARCKQRNPGDADCVSDHCTPKLNECRTTGCWQEGKLYGGALTCKLVKR